MYICNQNIGVCVCIVPPGAWSKWRSSGDLLYKKYRYVRIYIRNYVLLPFETHTQPKHKYIQSIHTHIALTHLPHSGYTHTNTGNNC